MYLNRQNSHLLEKIPFGGFFAKWNLGLCLFLLLQKSQLFLRLELSQSVYWDRQFCRNKIFMRKNRYIFAQKSSLMYLKMKWLKSSWGYLSSHLRRLQEVYKEPRSDPSWFLKALYSCCNLDNSVPAERVWSIWSLQLSHIQVAVNGKRKGSAQLGFYCQNSFPAWLANNKRWQNTFYHQWWPKPYIPPSRVTDIHVWFLLLGSGCSGKVKPSLHIECSSSSLTGTNFESSWGSTLSTCSCPPFTSKSHWHCQMFGFYSAALFNFLQLLLY